MKKICLIITLLATCLANLSFCCLMYAEDTPDKVSIDLQTVKDKNHYERDLYDSIKADYYFRGSRLEISCADEGVVSVYLFNSRNQMCGYSEYDSAENPIGRLDVPKQSGTYHIVIITDKSYSEGSFAK